MWQPGLFQHFNQARALGSVKNRESLKVRAKQGILRGVWQGVLWRGLQRQQIKRYVIFA